MDLSFNLSSNEIEMFLAFGWMVGAIPYLRIDFNLGVSPWSEALMEGTAH
jgi:hypothetical protein